ncbi:hypothetical protein HYDPIDRAFT_102234 [Hydnomerulius pinastri MD-312]|uniref:Uncharacterized protein n=1 Tax=Hydnomerulius pinastri MD-312 TaxID=994086 RepID=A0A0C9W7Y9_9AGAM|nr:hypothetical protein HYDPIDRAFT_102234 [Hydnomerulius pinastri MD-312]
MVCTLFSDVPFGITSLLTFVRGAGLCVAEVWAIFKLPAHLGHYPHPLAYVHWFKLLQAFDEKLQMFRVGRATQNQCPHAGIISVNKIIQPCHLVPKFPVGAVHPSWLKGSVLNESPQFFLNHYADFCIFEQYEVHS